MSCAAGNPNFRLLDVNVGWSASSAVNIAGLADAGGIYLAQTVAGAVDPNQILPYLCPARLARGCGDCEWYLITPALATAVAGSLRTRAVCRPRCHQRLE
jgi:hypothetical protein